VRRIQRNDAARRRIVTRAQSERHNPEEVVAKLRQVDVLTSQGTPIVDAIRSIGVTEVTYYRWRNEYGGLKSDQVKRLKDLETENARPGHIRSDNSPEFVAKAAREWIACQTAPKD
jgi:putative transposase